MKKIVIIFLFLMMGLASFLLYNFFKVPNVKTTDIPIVVSDPVDRAKPVEIPATSTEPNSFNASEPIKEPITSTTSVILATSTEPAPVSVPIISDKEIIKMIVPFTAQAPLGEWSDLRQQNACEEAAAIMAIRWVNGQSLTFQEAKAEIIAIADWEQEKYGIYQDTSVSDTVDRIFKEYFAYQKAEAINGITLPDIIDELEQGNLVITPMNGQKLGNPFFTSPGPLEHMLVIIGYDYQTEEFIVNESGTRHGKDYRYDQDVLFNAIRDYPTGYHEPIIGTPKNIIVVQK